MTGIRPAPRPASPPCWMRRILVGVLMSCVAAIEGIVSPEGIWILIRLLLVFVIACAVVDWASR
jgi:hypothetical protein